MIRGVRGTALAWLASLLAHVAGVLFLWLLTNSARDSVPPVCETGVARDLVLSMFDVRGQPVSPPPSGDEEEHVAEVDFPVSIGELTDAMGSAIPAPLLVGSPKGEPSSALVAGPAAGGGFDGRGGLLVAPAHARSIVYVIDRSLSMGLNGALARARREVIASLSRLSPETSFQVIFYNGQPKPLRIGGRDGFLAPDADTRRAVAEEIERVVAAGPTDHLGALKAGLALRPDVLFFVTDADDLTDQQVRELARLNGHHTVIHTVELTRRSPDAAGPLHRLARENGGSYRQAAPAD